MITYVVRVSYFSTMGLEQHTTWYYVYQITNLLNGKIYVGIHRTSDIDDGYMGSGKLLRRAYRKYGMHRFSKKILFYCNSEEELISAESRIVTSDFVRRKNTYNLTEGGRDFGKQARVKGGRIVGSLTSKQKRGYHSPEAKQRHKEVMPEVNARLKFEQKGFYNPDTQKEMRRRACSPAAKEKRNETLKRIKHQQGERNSRYGTIWITNGEISKSVLKEEQIPEGFWKGRVIKKPA